MSLSNCFSVFKGERAAAVKYYDTFAKRLSDVSSVCNTSHVDYCMPRHKPITKGSVCVCVCAHPKHMAEYLKVGECVFRCAFGTDRWEVGVCLKLSCQLQLVERENLLGYI